MLSLAALVSTVALFFTGGTSTAEEQATAPPPLGSASPIALSVSGRGWGHGVGMSQWGAYGYAQHGATYEQILTHYYSGTQLGRAGGGSIRVLLADGVAAVEVASAGALSVKDGSGAAHDLAAGTYKLTPELKLKVDPDAPAAPLPGPLVFTAKSQPLSVGGKRYRGSVEIAVTGGKLRAVNTLSLEAYLLGVVPSEMPTSWPAEALKAQAVAARSYALATRKAGAFDVYPDTRSQVYGGIDAERPEATAAVQATAGQVVLYGGAVATTYFFSSSGGRTADATDVWPGAGPIPYLKSVADPYDNASPYHVWGPTPLRTNVLRSALRLPAAPVDVRVKTTRSGHVSQLIATMAGGATVSAPAGTVRTALGLRSTWFRIGVLSLRPPAKTPVTYGTRALLGGLARGVPGAAIERLSTSGVWENVAAVKPAKDGSFTLPVRVERTADYRLAVGNLRVPAVRVAVAPWLKLTLGSAPGTLAGTVRPVMPGAVVVVQRLAGATWTKAASAKVEAAGSFQADVGAAPGTYRARLAPRSGYAAGVSRQLSIAP